MYMKINTLDEPIKIKHKALLKRKKKRTGIYKSVLFSKAELCNIPKQFSLVMDP